MSKAAELAALIGSGQAQGNKNLIINGAMNMAQRGTSAVTIADAAQYRVDRFNAYDNTSGAFTYEQSTTTPSGEGFINSTKLTVTSADTSIAAGEYAYYAQYIEGTKFSQCDFGNSGAKSVTLSFFVRSSATGTYCVTLANSASNRSFVSEYTISSANTWEKKTITVAGDTTGTWLTTTGIGLKVFFCLAVGSTYQQSAGSWGTTSFAFGSSNQTNWLGTNGNTLYITGVQLEVGEQATPFEYEDITTTLRKCQRYLYRLVTDVDAGAFVSLTGWNTNDTYGPILYPVEMRAAPTLSIGAEPADFLILSAGTNPTVTELYSNGSSKRMMELRVSSTGNIVAGRPYWGRIIDTTNGYIQWDAEL